MKTGLTATVVATAALSSALSVGMMQLTSSAPAGATPRASSAAAPPPEMQLLTKIANNTATSAARLKIVNANLISFYKKMATDFDYHSPRTGYVGNEQHLQEATLCDIDYWVQVEVS